MFFAVLTAALLPAYAAAQNIFTVEVGPSLTFSPGNTPNVANGDIVQFAFKAAGHTVTQSTLANPCTPLDGGFSSGTSASGDVWNLTISDASRPIWFFCATNSPIIHCEQGMVGAINSGDDAFSSYTEAAKAATNTPTATAVVLSGSGAAATASLTSAAVASGSAASGSGSSSTGTATGSAATTQSSSAAQPFAGFESLGATVLALFGALLF